MRCLILWDWDNTLADTFDVIVKAQHDTQKHFGVPLLSKEQIMFSMNKSSLEIFKEVLGAQNAQAGVDYFWEAYSKHIKNLKLKEGALQALEFSKSKAFINVLASAKEIDVLLSEAKQLNIASYFDRIVGESTAKENKPSTLFIKEAIKGFSFDKIISIGDRRSDVLMAKNTQNAISILVETDPTAAEFKDCRPDYSVKNMNDLVRLLTEVFQ